MRRAEDVRPLEKKERGVGLQVTDRAEDLRRWLGGEPIQARPVGKFERIWQWCRRKPVVATLSAAVVVSLLSGFAVSTFFGGPTSAAWTPTIDCKFTLGRLAVEIPA